MPCRAVEGTASSKIAPLSVVSCRAEYKPPVTIDTKGQEGKWFPSGKRGQKFSV